MQKPGKHNPRGLDDPSCWNGSYITLQGLIWNSKGKRSWIGWLTWQEHRGGEVPLIIPFWQFITQLRSRSVLHEAAFAGSGFEKRENHMKYILPAPLSIDLWGETYSWLGATISSPSLATSPRGQAQDEVMEPPEITRTRPSLQHIKAPPSRLSYKPIHACLLGKTSRPVQCNLRPCKHVGFQLRDVATKRPRAHS